MPAISSATSLPSRADALAAAEAARDIDVLVVGGGINGAGTFRDLTLQGLKVMIVDRVDWGAGASMASSRMAHGGLRYLENGEFRLTAEATRERNRLLRAAGHLIRPLPMAIPYFSYAAGLLTSFKRAVGLRVSLRERGFIMAETGLFLYDWFGRFHRSMPRHRAMLGRGVRRAFPALHPAVRAASIYYDAVIDAPERIAVELIGEGLAASPDSIAVNHCSLVAVENNAVVLCDEATGKRFALRPKVLVNATGAWIDFANRTLGVQRSLMGGTKGSHIVLDHPELFEALAGHGMIFDDGAGRVCIIYPMRDKVLLGATDIPVADPDLAHCSDEEEDYLLAAARVVFPKIDFGREHVVFRFCGVRPLPKSDAATPGAVSRDHSIVTLEPEAGRTFPIFCLVGGKWTTFRAFSAAACEAVLAKLGKTRSVDVDTSEIAHIEGFDEDTASEIQTRAREYLDRQEAERDARRKELGVADELASVPGVTTAMLVALGENDIKTVEDLAGAVPDDLVGWTERPKERDAEPVRHKGALDGLEIGRKEAEDMIMAARIAAGWVTEEELEKARAKEAEAAAAAAAEAAKAAEAVPAAAKA